MALVTNTTEIDVFASQLELDSNDGVSVDGFQEHEHSDKKQVYLLAVVDKITGLPVRAATDEDISKLPVNLLKQQPTNQTTAPAKSKDPNAITIFQLLVAEAKTKKKHSVCCLHCGIRDTPQWRKGPDATPILCNACGTRYQRTNQLGPGPTAASAIAAIASAQLVVEQKRLLLLEQENMENNNSNNNKNNQVECELVHSAKKQKIDDGGH